MTTKLLDESKLRDGAAMIRGGGIVAFRTETVYGLGADATNDEAVKKIFTAKGRPPSNPLIVHFYDLKHLMEYFSLSGSEKNLLKKIKGSLTIVLTQDCPRLAPSVKAGLNSFAVRIPSCHFARQFIRACGVPIAAPSANTSSRPSPTHWQAVRDDLDGKIDAIFMGSRTKVGVESTVVSTDDTSLKILRQGGISMKTLEKKSKMPVHLAMDHSDLEKSPGTRFKHYSPCFPVVILMDYFDIMDLTYEKDFVVLAQSHNFNYTAPNILFLGKTARAVNANLFYLLREAERILKSKKGKKEKIIIIENLPDTDEYATARERVHKASLI